MGPKDRRALHRPLPRARRTLCAFGGGSVCRGVHRPFQRHHARGIEQRPSALLVREKMSLKTFVQGFGAAITVLILRVWPHLSSYHPVIYHSFLPLRSVIWGVLLDLGVFTLLAALLFRYLEQNETGLRTVLWAFVAAELAAASVTAMGVMRRAPI